MKLIKKPDITPDDNNCLLSVGYAPFIVEQIRNSFTIFVSMKYKVIFYFLLVISAHSCRPGEKTENKTNIPALKNETTSTEDDLTPSDPENLNKNEDQEPEVIYPEPRRYYGRENEGEQDTAIYKEGNKILTEGYVTGKFIDIQRGDYLHIVLLDSAHWYHTFFVWFEDKDKIQRYWEGEKPAYMQKIKVHWKRERLHLEEASGKMTIYEMIDLEEIEE